VAKAALERRWRAGQCKVTSLPHNGVSVVQLWRGIYIPRSTRLAGAALGPVWAYCGAAGAAREPGLGSIGSPAPEPQLSWEWEFVSGDSKGFLRYNAGACVRVRVRVCVCVCVRV
jgi:hypothetical protein